MSHNFLWQWGQPRSAQGYWDFGELLLPKPVQLGSDPITGATLRLLVRSTLDSHGNVQTTQLGVEAIPRDQRGSASSPPLYLRVPSTNNQVAQVKGAVSVNVAGCIPMVDLVDAVVLP
jgi:hypothetical protein